MNIRTTWQTMAVLTLAAGVSLSGDQIRLRSGKTVKGIFIGGDSKAVRVLLDNGQVVEVPLGDAIAVEFTPRKPAQPPASPNPAGPPKTVAVPAGTTVNVRLTQAIDVDASQAGMKFKAIVDDPVMMAGSIVIPRGAVAVLQAVHVQQSGKMKGSDKISLKLNSIGFGGRVYERGECLRRDQGQGRGQENRAKGRGGRRPRRDCRRYRRRR